MWVKEGDRKGRLYYDRESAPQAVLSRGDPCGRLPSFPRRLPAFPYFATTWNGIAKAVAFSDMCW